MTGKVWFENTTVFQKDDKFKKIGVNPKELIVKNALTVISVESKAIGVLNQVIDISYVRLVEMLAAIEGRIVWTGMGKSALVAQKIVATLNSTGTPSMFMHAAEATHGDLGMLMSGDVLICLSKSGETNEIRSLVPWVKALGNTIVGISNTKESFLSENADYFIHLPLEEEAEPNNLAPTASTAQQMAIGDAIAVSLLALRGFSADDFSKFHPGGTIGKRMFFKVGDLSIHNPSPKVRPDAGLSDIILEISSGRLGMTVVCEEDGIPLGVITDGDLRRMLAQSDWNELSISARSIMSLNPKVIRSQALAVEALAMMRENSITQVVVTDEVGLYIGVVHLHDLIREGLIG